MSRLKLLVLYLPLSSLKNHAKGKRRKEVKDIPTNSMLGAEMKNHKAPWIAEFNSTKYDDSLGGSYRYVTRWVVLIDMCDASLSKGGRVGGS